MKKNVVIASVIIFQIFSIVILLLSGFSNPWSPAIFVALIVLGIITDAFIIKSFSILQEIKENNARINETDTLNREMAMYNIKTGNDLFTLQQLQDEYICHIRTIKGHLSEGKTTIDKDISATSTTLRNALDEIYTENPVINTVLILKKTFAIQSGVDVSYSIMIPDDPPFADLDMCTLLCNMLDNAIEAASKCPSEARYIKLQIKPRSNFLFISTQNSVANEALSLDFSKTSKNSPEDHGLVLN